MTPQLLVNCLNWMHLQLNNLIILHNSRNEIIDFGVSYITVHISRALKISKMETEIGRRRKLIFDSRNLFQCLSTITKIPSCSSYFLILYLWQSAEFDCFLNHYFCRSQPHNMKKNIEIKNKWKCVLFFSDHIRLCCQERLFGWIKIGSLGSLLRNWSI